MKTILYMGMTANGYIAKLNGDSEWTSQEDLNGFYEQSKKAGNIIMGKQTFRAALSYGYFPFPETLNVVMTHESIKNTWGENRVMLISKTPQAVLALLEAKGFSTAFLAGGGELNSSFARAGLIDEIYLDVEPLVLGKGIRLFSEGNFEFDLKLLNLKQLNTDTVQLHYQVVKEMPAPSSRPVRDSASSIPTPPAGWAARDSISRMTTPKSRPARDGVS